MDTRELAWASGLFEGEGCITLAKPKQTRMVYALLSLAMQDEDAVRRFHAAVGVGAVSPRAPHGTNRRTLWVWRSNSFENSQAVLAMLWFGLAERRRARAREVFAAVRAARVNYGEPLEVA